jgi:hypothetical protein
MPDPAEEAQIQQMLLSLLTNRQPEPVQEQTPLQQGRAAKAAEMMKDPFWQGAPMYYEPAAAFNFTDENVRRSYLERLANDAEHRSHAPRPEDVLYRQAWEEGLQEDDVHPDWAFRPGTPAWFEPKR